MHNHELFMWILGQAIKNFIPSKNNTLIMISLVNLLHYWHLEFDGLQIKFYLLKKLFILTSVNMSETFTFDRNGRIV